MDAVPHSSYTMDVRGTSEIRIAGRNNKTQVTALIAITRSGETLPVQMLYKGKTHRCLPNAVNAPNDWDLWYTRKHWSTNASKIRYIQQVIIPYLERKRRPKIFGKYFKYNKENKNYS